MCLPGSQDEIDWSAFGIDERVTLVVSPPQEDETSSSSLFALAACWRTLTQESIMMIWPSKALEKAASTLQ